MSPAMVISIDQYDGTLTFLNMACIQMQRKEEGVDRIEGAMESVPEKTKLMYNATGHSDKTTMALLSLLNDETLAIGFYFS